MSGGLQALSAPVIQDATTEATEVETDHVEEVVLTATTERSAHRLSMATSCTSCDEVSDESVDLLFCSICPGQVQVI